jgi:nitroreductase
MNLYDAIMTRRSVRSYKPDPIDDEAVERILAAARRAPSAGNRQPVFFYVIKDKDTRRGLLNAYNQEWLATAPVAVVACAEPDDAWKRSDGKCYSDVDVSIAMDHLVLAATAEGLGTCWIGAFKPDVVRALLDIPEHLEPVAMTPIGVPGTEPDGLTPRKPIEEIVEYR